MSTGTPDEPTSSAGGSTLTSGAEPRFREPAPHGPLRPPLAPCRWELPRSLLCPSKTE